MEKVIGRIRTFVDRNPADIMALRDWFDSIRIIGKDDKRASYLYLPEFRTKVSRARRVTEDIDDFKTLTELQKQSHLYSARDIFDDFLIYNEWNRQPNNKFYAPRRRVLLPIVRAFQRVHDGQLDLLTVSQPKRTGKTTLGLNFILFRAGNDPMGNSLGGGAGDALVKSFYNGALEILRDPEYTYYEIFPDAGLVRTNADEKTIDLGKAKRFSTITMRSIEGALVGSTQASPSGVCYLDDLVKDDVEAKNRNRLDSLWDRCRGDLLGRRLEGTPIIAQGTRYSIYDPIGRLQEAAQQLGWRHEILEIPALSLDTDESNFEIEVEGRKLFTTEYYRKERELVSEEQWESQFQQQPFEAKGLMFPKDSLNYFENLPPDREPDAIIACGDTAETGEDSTSMPLAYLYGDDVFIVDVVFDNSPSDVTKPQCAKMLVEYKASTAIFESNNAGEYFGKDVADLVKANGGKVSFRYKRNIANKQTRIEFASDGIKKHFYFKHPRTYARDSQYARFMRELTTHTRTGKVPHDDAADSLALMENEIRQLAGTKVQIIERPF